MGIWYQCNFLYLCPKLVWSEAQYTAVFTRALKKMASGCEKLHHKLVYRTVNTVLPPGPLASTLVGIFFPVPANFIQTGWCPLFQLILNDRQIQYPSEQSCKKHVIATYLPIHELKEKWCEDQDIQLWLPQIWFRNAASFPFQSDSPFTTLVCILALLYRHLVVQGTGWSGGKLPVSKTSG